VEPQRKRHFQFTDFVISGATLNHIPVSAGAGGLPLAPGRIWRMLAILSQMKGHSLQRIGRGSEPNRERLDPALDCPVGIISPVGR
jgi:hypothetical protein